MTMVVESRNMKGISDDDLTNKQCQWFKDWSLIDILYTLEFLFGVLAIMLYVYLHLKPCTIETCVSSRALCGDTQWYKNRQNT